MSQHEEAMAALGGIKRSSEEALRVMKEAGEAIVGLQQQVDFYKRQYDLAKARSTYPEFCKHPGKCAGAGRCMAEWVCND